MVSFISVIGGSANEAAIWCLSTMKSIAGDTSGSTLKLGRPKCIQIFTQMSQTFSNLSSSISLLYVSSYISFPYLSYKYHHWSKKGFSSEVGHFACATLSFPGRIFFFFCDFCANFDKTLTKNYLDCAFLLSPGRWF